MELKDTINQRRASRAFEPIEITDKMITEIAETAVRAASCANKQPWRFVFVKSKEALSKLHETLVSGNYWAKDASMLVAVFSKKELDCVVGNREYYLFDTGMATAQLMLAIVEKGLVAHAMAGFNSELAKKALNIPEDMNLITLIAVGKHSEDFSKLGEKHQETEKIRSIRKPFEEYAYIDEFKG